jgi:glycosyltransferase involved in cell wall biosynthesis
MTALMPIPEVSVIIPAYNAARHVTGAVESALEGGAEVEVIVVDDGSQDDTADVAQAASPRVRVLRRGNGGPGAARNAGIAAARAPLVAFLDVDDRWQAGSLARRVAALGEERSALLVHGLVTFVDAEGRAIAFDPLAYRVRAEARRGRVLRALFWHNFVHTSTVVARRAALEAAGGFDERREIIEDYDLWLRLAARGRFAFVPEVVAVYLWHAQSLGRTNVERSFLGQVAPLEGALARGGLARTVVGRAWLRRRRLALLHADHAADLLRFRGDTAGAAAALARSLALQPLAPRRAAVLLAAQAGPGAVEGARRVVRGLRGLTAGRLARRP